MATWLDDVTQALTALHGVARLSDIYDDVRRIRPAPHPITLEQLSAPVP